MKKKLYIFGSGGHAKVILSEILTSNRYNEIIFVNPNSRRNEITINNTSFEVINNITAIISENSFGIIGIGDLHKRLSIVKEIDSKIPNFKWATIISKNVTIAKDVMIKEGTVVISGSIINTGTIIGKHCIINTRSSIDHDNKIGDFVNISPSVVTGGNVIIGEASDIGISSVIKNNTCIARNVVIGGNSFVNKDCLPNSLYYGSPIKKIK